MIKHIIFDCDGVLIDTEMIAAEIVSDYLRSKGLDISAEQFIAHYTGKTFTDIFNDLKMSGELNPAIDTTSAIASLDAQIKSNQRAIEGAIHTLKSLDLPFSVVSNSAYDYVMEAMVKLGVQSLVHNRIFCAEMVERGKPDPMVYLLAVEKIDLLKEEILVVEDSTTGVQASIAAGLKTIGFLGGSHIRDGHGTKLISQGCFKTVHDHHELLDFLQNC
jgi:HAD superfamily hydrolase (TIGR01509 family)